MGHPASRVLFFTSSLGGGGAEMHLLRVINALDRTRVEPWLAVARSGGSYEARLAPDVPIQALTGSERGSSTLKLLKSVVPLRRLIAEVHPDIVCAVMDQPSLIALLATRGLRDRPRLVLCVQNTPTKAYRDPPSVQGRVLLAAISRLYPLADHVVALSQGVADDLASLNPALAAHTSVIHNSCVDEFVLAGAKEPVEGATTAAGKKVILGCGRLVNQKGFTYLIDAFDLVRRRIPSELWLVGEGPEKTALERKCAHLGLTDCVRFLGFQDNPYKYMAAADVFVLSSLYEGFGNVVVEAMACGTAVVSTDCPSGPSEIIHNMVNGMLVPVANPMALVKAILQTLEDHALRRDLVKNALTRSRDFTATAVASSYAGLFEQLLASDGVGRQDSRVA